AADPNFAMAAATLGGLVLTKGRPEESIELFQRAIRLSPRTAEYYQGLAGALGRLYRLAEAETALQCAAELSPGDHEARPRLAYMLYERGKLQEAIRHYQMVLDARADDIAVRGQVLLSRLRLCDWQNFAEESRRILSGLSQGGTGASAMSLPFLAV